MLFPIRKSVGILLNSILIPLIANDIKVYSFWVLAVPNIVTRVWFNSPSSKFDQQAHSGGFRPVARFTGLLPSNNDTNFMACIGKLSHWLSLLNRVTLVHQAYFLEYNSQRERTQVLRRKFAGNH